MDPSSRQTGFALIQVMVGFVLLAMLALSFVAFLRSHAQMLRHGEDKMSVVELHDYIHDNVGCNTSFRTYITPSGDTSACRFPSARAHVRRKDGSSLISDIEVTRIRNYELRASCQGTRKLNVEYRDLRLADNGPATIRRSMPSLPPVWRPLFGDGETLCEGDLLPVSGWRPGVVMVNTPPAFVDDGAKATSPTVLVHSAVTVTEARCPLGGNFYSGFVNCPSGYRLFSTELDCPIAGRHYTSALADGGIQGVCCRSAGMLSASCTKDYAVRPELAGLSDRFREVRARDRYWAHTGMKNTYQTCAGPDPGTTYNRFSASLSCAHGYLPERATVSCGQGGSRLLKVHFGELTVTGDCCSSAGTLDLTCYGDATSRQIAMGLSRLTLYVLPTPLVMPGVSPAATPDLPPGWTLSPVAPIPQADWAGN